MAKHSDEQSELKQLADECVQESVQLLNEGKLKQSEEMLIRAKNIYEEIGLRRRLSEVLNLLSIVYDEMGNDSLDMVSLLDAIEIAMEDGYFDYAAKYYNNVGSKFMNVQANTRALNYFLKSEEMLQLACEKGLCKLDNFQSFTLILYLNLASIYCINGDNDKARKYYEMAKEVSTHPSNKDQFFTFQAFEGLLLWKIGEKEQAASLVDSIIDTVKVREYATDYLEIMSYLIQILSEMKDYKKWEEVLRIMDSRQCEDGSLVYRMELQKHWLEYYEAIGDEARYAEGCARFYDLSKEKSVLEFSQSADTIELQIQMRRAAKEKKLTDKIVYLDPLTGIGNRNSMLNDSKQIIQESVSSHKLIAIGLVDIDYFKECNDTYGHIKGDECLKIVASTLKEAVGETGKVYRYGGDEFLILIPDANVDDISIMGKKIKDTLVTIAMPNIKSAVSDCVTVSQGYTCAYADAGDTIEQLVDLADRVLYTVKRCGRNNYKYMHIDDVLKISK